MKLFNRKKNIIEDLTNFDDLVRRDKIKIIRTSLDVVMNNAEMAKHEHVIPPFECSWANRGNFNRALRDIRKGLK